MKSQRPITSDDEHQVLQFRPRTTPSPVIHRGSGTVQPLHAAAPEPLDLSRYEGLIPVEMFGQTAFPRIGELSYLLTLGPRGFFWFQLKKDDAL